MATENRASPTSLHAKPISPSPSQHGSEIQREASVVPSESEIESIGSGSTLATTNSPFSRPATRDISLEAHIQTPPPGSYIAADSRTGSRRNIETFQEPRAQRTTSMPLATGHSSSSLISLVDTPPASISTPAAIIERRSTTESADEGTPLLLAPKDHNLADENPSRFQLPTYLQCQFISDVFGKFYTWVKDFKESLYWENFTRPFGNEVSDIIRLVIFATWIDNFIGMIAQGLLGGLNAEDFSSTHISSAITLSISVLIVFTIAAMEGKRKLVGMFNQMSAERLPGRIDNFPSNVTIPDVLLSVVTWPIKIVISGVFAVLAQVSLSKENGASRVLLKYQQPWANSAANFLTSVPVTSIAMFSAFTINLIGFPTKFALLTLLDALNHAVRTPKYKQRQAEVQRHIDALLLYSILLFENNQHDEIQSLLHTIQSASKENQLDAVINYVHEHRIALPNPESWTQFFKRQLPALIAFAISVYGISNFYAIAETFLIPLLQLPESFAPAAGSMAMAGMTALCFMAVYVPLSSKEPELPIFTTGEKAWNWTTTLTIVGLGALTNLQQAIMTNTLTDPTAKAICYLSAFLSPILIEAKGYYTYTTTPLVKQRLENNNNLNNAHNGVEFFRSMRNAVPNLDEAELHQHYENITGAANQDRPPKYPLSLFFKSLKRQPTSADALEREFVLIESGQRGEKRAIN